ncbi:MAG TPA: hypothetical protein VLG36_00990 [Candidatus Chromulinivoraceae bacterium]|nr:hypothetical protein [Candidatus Chromulinivoraceae bacterium]
MEPANLLIDRIIYIASLVTNPAEVDTELDTLRSVTARIDDVSQPLKSQDRSALLRVQEQLEAYLVTREPLRQFTPDSLQLQIEQHMDGGFGRKSRTQLLIVIATATTLAIGASVLPLATIADRIMAGGATEFSLLTVGAAWLFWTALPAFKSDLRQAFLLICAGVTLLGISMLEQPILILLNLRHYPITGILFPLPILFGALLFHVGNLTYVHILGIHNRWTTITPLIVGMVIMSLFTLVIPYSATSESVAMHVIAATLWSWILVTPIASMLILPTAIARVPEIYKPSIRLLFQSMFPIAVVILYQYLVWLVGDPYSTGIITYGLFALVVIMGLSLLRAGYAFNKVSRY